MEKYLENGTPKPKPMTSDPSVMPVREQLPVIALNVLMVHSGGHDVHL